MIPQNELKAEEIRQYTHKILKSHVPLKVQGYRCDTDMIVDVLLKANAESSSLEAASADLEGVADSNTMREYLNEALDGEMLCEQETEMNAALAESIPSTMQRTKVEVAIDFHDEAFYWKQEALKKVTCHGQAKKSTTHFVRIATAYVIWKQVRLTLAVRYVLPEEETVDILTFLLQRLKDLGIVSQVLYLDKGFAAGPVVVRYLQEQHQPAIIACAIRGKDGGTRALCKGRGSYKTHYTHRWHAGDPGPESLWCPTRRRNSAASGWPSLSLIWIGRSRRCMSNTAVVLGWSVVIVPCAVCGPPPLPAIQRCAFSCYPSGCFWLMSGPSSAGNSLA